MGTNQDKSYLLFFSFSFFFCTRSKHKSLRRKRKAESQFRTPQSQEQPQSIQKRSMYPACLNICISLTYNREKYFLTYSLWYVQYDGPISRLTDDDPISRLTDDDPISRLTDDGPLSRLTDDDPLSRLTDDDPLARLTDDDPLSRLTDDDLIIFSDWQWAFSSVQWSSSRKRGLKLKNISQVPALMAW